MENYWIILGIISCVLLIIYFRKRNAIWGGLTLGVVVGIVIAIFKSDWFFLLKSGIFGTILGFITELLGKFSNYLKKQKQPPTF